MISAGVVIIVQGETRNSCRTSLPLLLSPAEGFHLSVVERSQ